MDIKQLIAALEEATGPSDKLDYEIFLAIGQKPDHLGRVGNYTASTEAAMALVPLELFCEELTNDENKGWVCLVTNGIPWHVTGSRAWNNDKPTTLPVAICIAALKAREYVP